MNEHFIVTLDRGHLRILSETQRAGEATPRLEVVEAMDFPQGHRDYTDRDTAAAGRFPNSKGRPGGMSIDERLPMKREEERRNTASIARELDHFLQGRPHASWDLAASPALFNSVIEELSPDTRRRLKRALSKDLVNQPQDEVRAQFATAGR